MGSEENVTTAFLATAEVVATLVGHPTVGRTWDRPSVLPHMTVGDLAAHLARAVNNVDTYLAEPAGSSGTSGPQGGADAAAGGEGVDGPGYFLAFDDLGPDVDSGLNRAVRERARAEASPGWRAVRETLGRSRENLARRLAEMEPTDPIRVLGSMDMELADYLRTRLIEMAVHLDDLAVSVGVDTPALPPGVSQLVIADLVEMARRRHGDLAVLRSLTRRERDPVEALRVL